MLTIIENGKKIPQSIRWYPISMNNDVCNIRNQGLKNNILEEIKVLTLTQSSLNIPFNPGKFD